jgi:hypothetical protein
MKMKIINYLKTAGCLLVFLIPASPLFSQGIQDTTYWTTSGQATLNFSQVSLSNWVSGGNSSVSGIGNFDFNAIYQKGRLQWDNTLKTGMGL